MPHRSRVAVSDVPVDVMIELFRNPDSYQPMLEGFREANRKAQQAEADAEARLDAATKKEQVAKTERGMADERIEKANKLESKLDALAADLAARQSAVEAQEREAKARAQSCAEREAALEEKLSALRSDLASLRAL